MREVEQHEGKLEGRQLRFFGSSTSASTSASLRSDALRRISAAIVCMRCIAIAWLANGTLALRLGQLRANQSRLESGRQPPGRCAKLRRPLAMTADALDAWSRSSWRSAIHARARRR